MLLSVFKSAVFALIIALAPLVIGASHANAQGFLTVMLVEPPTTVDAPFGVTVKFSEPVIGFQSSDVTVTGGRLISLHNTGDNINHNMRIGPGEAPGNIVITIAANAVYAALDPGRFNRPLRDSAGNLGVTVMVVPDEDGPTVTITGPASGTVGNVRFEAVVTFHNGEESVTRGPSPGPESAFIPDELILGNAMIITDDFKNNGNVFTIGLMITAPGPVTIDVAAGTITDAAGNDNTAADQLVLPYVPDLTPPTVTITGPASGTVSNTRFEVVVTFNNEGNSVIRDATSGPESRFISTELTRTNAVVLRNDIKQSKNSNNDDVFTLGLRASADPVIFDVAMGTVTDASSNPNTAAEQLMLTYVAPPTVTLSAPETVVGQTPFEVTATFSADVTGFAADDVTTANTDTPVVVSGNGRVYTLTVTPNGDGDIELSIVGDLRDGNVNVGNVGNVGDVKSSVATTETTRVAYLSSLTVTLSPVPASVISTTAFTITATFETAVTGFDMDDVSIDPPANATVAVTGSGNSYDIMVTPAGTAAFDFSIDGMVTVGTATIAVSTMATRVTPVIAPATLTAPIRVFNTQDFGVTVKFRPGTTFFDTEAITVMNALASFSVGPSVVSITPALTYDLGITPDGLGDIVITFPVGSIRHAGGSNTVAVSLTVFYEPPPTVTLTAPDELIGRAPFTVTMRFFDENDMSVNVNFNPALVEVINGNDTNANQDIIENIDSGTLSIMPDAGTEAVTVKLLAGAFRYASGSANTAVADIIVEPDTTGPTLTPLVGPSPSTVPTLAEFDITATFSEPVLGFDADSISITITSTDGTTVVVSDAVSVAQRGSTPVYTVTITPPTDLMAGDIISIADALSDVTDAALNAATGAPSSVAVTYRPPTVMLSGAPTAVNTMDEFDVTATFSSAEAGFGVNHVTITPAGYASVMVEATANDNVYTLKVTPSGGGNFTIGIAYNGASDTVLVLYDTTAPTLSLAGPDPTNTLNTFDVNALMFEITATFTEDVIGFDAADITATGSDVNPASIDVMSKEGSASVYTVTITLPAGTPTDQTYTISAADLMGVEDLATNAITAANNALTVTYKPPTAPRVMSLVGPDSHDGSSEFTVMVTLSETATDFVEGDIVFSSNASGMLSGSGTSYELTVTPTDTNSITIDIPANSFTGATNIGNTASDTLTVLYVDTTPPTVMSLVGPDSHDGSSEFMVTVTLSEPSTDFVVGDVTVSPSHNLSTGTAPTLTPVMTLVSGTTYTLNITPDHTDSIEINIAMDSFTGATNIGNTASDTLTVLYVDTTPPTVMSLVGPDSHDGSSEFMVTVTLSEPSTDFVVGDVTVSPSHNLSTGTAPTLTPVMTLVSGTTYTLNITPDHTDSIEINIAMDSFTDAATNGNTASDTLTVLYVDTTPPTVMSLVGPDSHDGSSEFMVTVTLSEPSTDFVVGDVTVSPSHNLSTGTAPTLTPVMTLVSGTTYTLNITPDHTDSIEINIAMDSFTDAATNGNTASDTLTVLYVDTTPPTVMSLVGPDSHDGSSEFMVTVTLSEPSTDFVVGDVTVSPSHNLSTGTAPTLTPVMTLVSGTTYTLNITPDHTDSIEINIAMDSFTDAATNGNTASDTLTVLYVDTTPPTVMSLVGPDSHDGSSEFMVTVTLSEPSTDFVVGDVTVSPSHNLSTGTAPTLTPVMTLVSGTTYTLNITPDHTDSIEINIAMDSFTGATNIGNTASDTLTVLYVDTTPPTVMSLVGPDSHDGSSEFMVTVTLSEPSTDFVVGDVTVSPSHNLSTGTAPTLTPVMTLVSGTTYTLNITPDHTDSIEINIAMDSFTGATNIGNTASDTLEITYMAPVTPTVMLSGAPATANTTAFNVMATFTPHVTGLLPTHVTISPSENADVTDVTEVTEVMDNDSYYDIEVTPKGLGDFTIAIGAGAFMNNAASTPEVRVTHDAVGPTVKLAAVPATVNSQAPFIMVVKFSEQIKDDIVVRAAGNYMTLMNATYKGLGSEGFDFFVEITPNGNGDITIDIPANAVTDIAGNGNSALMGIEGAEDVTGPVIVRYSPPPTAMLTVPTELIGSEPFAVTVTFSEAVSFDTTMVSVMGGTYTPEGTVNVAVTGTTYTHTLTITPGSSTTPVTVTLLAGAFSDIAATPTPNTMAVVSEPVAVDTTSPTPVLTSPAVILDVATFDVTVDFEEPVENLLPADIVTINDYFDVKGGTAVAFDATDDPSTYTLRIEPTASNVEVTFRADKARDLADNLNLVSNELMIEYRDDVPTVQLTGAPDTFNDSTTTFEVTATFSEPVTGLEAAEIEVRNGTAVLSGSGANYVLTITPDADDDADGMGDIEVTIPADAAVDASGNNNAASDLVSVTYVADAIAPTVTLAGPDTLSNLEPLAVTLTFSEVVTGLEVADIEVANGAVTTLSGSGAVYVLSLTPTGNGDLTVTIPAAAAMDAAANGNAASAALAVVNTIVADTQAAIAGFMLDRANNLARNQPGLTRFLQGTGCGSSLSANNTGTAHGCVSRGQTWGELSNLRSSDSSYTLVTLGAHRFVRDSLIIGGLVQLDAVDDDARNITGHGWLAGPYFVSKPADQNMVLEGRLLYGQTDNDISPLGSYEDSFETDRYLAQLRVTGQYSYQMVTLMPLLDFTYTEDMQQDYTDTLNNLINEQGIDLTQVTFGMDFRLPVAVQMGQLDLTGGLSGTYSEVNGGAADFERGRGRVELGLNYASDNGTTLAGGIFYDGISSDHESYGVNLSFDMKF